jgi:Na+-transporting methylmalonyl-CoA/oxaloacetate decarboxylase gamma subunit
MLKLLFLLNTPVVLVGVVLILLVILILLLYLRGKIVVTVPSITLDPIKAQVDHGESVPVTGAVYLDTGTPAAGESITLKVTDSAGTEFDNVGTAQSGADGKYAGSFDVPSAMAPGQATLEAVDDKLGVTATQTFTLLG